MVQLVEIDAKWVRLFTNVAARGAISYNELKRIDTFEFFHMFNNLIEDSKHGR